MNSYYLVTSEIKTPWWKKILRFLRIMKKKETFCMTLHGQYFKVGDIFHTGPGETFLILQIL
jgi:hypothetical protein